MINNLDELSLEVWIENSLRDNTHTLAAGYQGKTLIYNDSDLPLVIKVPHGRGIIRLIHRYMLKREHQVYQHLHDFDGVPKCLGFINNTYLVLEYVDGEPIRNKRPEDTTEYFSRMLKIIENLHHRGIAHLDLKKKDNLLVTTDDLPCLIDFGTAIIKKHGFHPLNNYLYNMGIKFDFNAWVKHKYHDDKNISEEDTMYLQRTYIERLSSVVKKAYQKLIST